MDGETIHSKMLEKNQFLLLVMSPMECQGEIKNQTNKKIKIPDLVLQNL